MSLREFGMWESKTVEPVRSPGPVRLLGVNMMSNWHWTLEGRVWPGGGPFLYDDGDHGRVDFRCIDHRQHLAPIQEPSIRPLLNMTAASEQSARGTPGLASNPWSGSSEARTTRAGGIIIVCYCLVQVGRDNLLRLHVRCVRCCWALRAADGSTACD
jgi:hypothetical protein